MRQFKDKCFDRVFVARGMARYLYFSVTIRNCLITQFDRVWFRPIDLFNKCCIVSTTTLELKFYIFRVGHQLTFGRKQTLLDSFFTSRKISLFSE